MTDPILSVTEHDGFLGTKNFNNNDDKFTEAEPHVRSKPGVYKRFFKSSYDDLNDNNFYRALLAEMLGDMCLVYVVCNSPYGELTADLDHVRVSLTSGLTVATLVWVLADVSGAHLNPAVSAGLFVTRKISLARCILYIVAQCVGAILGSALQKALTCDWQVMYAETKLQQVNTTCGLGMTELGPGITDIQGFFIELLITFILGITIFASLDKSRSDLQGSGPLAIGLSVTMCHLSSIKTSGASMNSARTFGPAVMLGAWDNQWVYWAGPIAGGVLAGFVYEFLLAADASSTKVLRWLKSVDYGKEGKSCEPDKLYEMKLRQYNTRYSDSSQY